MSAPSLQRQCPYCDEPGDGAFCDVHSAPTIDLSQLGLPASPIVDGATLGDRYRIGEALGDGFSGVVHRATQLAFGRDVAVKVLKSKTFHSPRPLLRFFREAHSIGRLNHPNIVQVFDFGVDSQSRVPYIVFELVDGRTLTDVIRADAPLPATRAAHLMAQVARALAQAHALGLVHRDIKPGNVMVTRLVADVELVKVLDFGLAKVSGDDGKRLTAPGRLVGTPNFASPEQQIGRSVDARSDLYGLGCTLYACLAARAPFVGDSAAALLEAHRHAPPPALPPSASALDPLYRALLAKDPSDRPANAIIVAEILEAIANEVPIDMPSRLVAARTEIAPLADLIPEAETDIPTRATMVTTPDEPEPSVTWPDASASPTQVATSVPIDDPILPPTVTKSRPRSPVRWLLPSAGVLGLLIWLLVISSSPTRIERARPPEPAATPESTTPVVAPREPAPTLVHLNSVPAGASVFLDGRQHGVTPVELRIVRRVDVRLELEGHRAATVSVEPDASDRVVRLVRVPKRRTPAPKPAVSPDKPKPDYPAW